MTASPTAKILAEAIEVSDLTQREIADRISAIARAVLRQRVRNTDQPFGGKPSRSIREFEGECNKRRHEFRRFLIDGCTPTETDLFDRSFQLPES